MKNEIPYICDQILKRILKFDEYKEKSGDFAEINSELQREKGKLHALIWCWLQIIIMLFIGAVRKTIWSRMMFKNYLKIAVRNLGKYKGYSFVNIAGLALGMACCTLIALTVINELNFNTFHENTKRIFCVGNYQDWEGNVWHVSATPALLAPAMKEDFPEVEYATRYTGFGQCLVNYGERSFFENRIFHVDPDFLQIFTFPLFKGDKNTALNDPNSIIISQGIAEKYFPEEDPMGKVLRINDEYNFTVTGVLKDKPHNSMHSFEMLVPFRFREEQYRKEGTKLHWRWNNPRTYVLLIAGSMYQPVNEKIANYVKQKAGTDNAPEFAIIPLEKYRFSPWGGGPNRIRNLTIISTIAFIILLIACINFMNLSTARSANRAKEIGMRKVVGAMRKNVIVQFLSESLILSFSAMVLALMMVVIMLPEYNNIFGFNMPLSILAEGYVIPVMFLIALFTGLIGGSYPAFFLSSFRPVLTLRGDLRSGTKSGLIRRGLVVFQFVLSLTLIIGTVVIYKQIDFIKNKEMGFDKQNIMYIPLRAGTSNTYEALKTRLLTLPGIENVTAASHKPTSIGSNTGGIKWEGKSPEYNTLVHVTSVELEYLETLNIELIEGRDFSSEFPSDPGNSFIINERMKKDIGKDNILGTPLESGWIGNGKIIGVVKDFHFRPLNDEIPPLVICMSWNDRRFAMVKLAQANIAYTISSIKDNWTSVNPAYPFEYNFFDVEFDRSYSVETRLANIVKTYAVLGILIACLGLFGLASFTAEQRTKEIGIRKVLGASIPGVAKLISREFVMLVLASNLAAWPISYMIMNNWLQGFAYRTGIGIWTLLIPAIFAIIITVLTVSFQAIKAAVKNPVKSLRYE